MNGTIGPQATAMIQHYESCRLIAYEDDGGIWTIGWGHTGLAVRAGLEWTQQIADAQWLIDIGKFEKWVVGMIKNAPTTPAQFGALVSTCYNAGPGSLANSPILSAHLSQDYQEVITQWPHWHIKDHTGVVEPGLVTRRATEARFYQSGTWH